MPPQFSTDQLKTFARDLLGKGKADLLKSGRVNRIAFAFAPVEGYPDPLPPGSEERGMVATVLPLAGDRGRLLKMIATLSPKAMPPLQAAMRIAKEHGVSDAEALEIGWRAFRAATGEEANDVIAAFLEYELRRLHAFAWVHLSETWFSTPPADAGEAVMPSEDPERREAVAVSWETRDDGEWIVVPFRREGEPEKGKVVGFDEPRILPGKMAGGRLAHLLAPVPETLH